jgi:hypothetical protein
VEWAWGGFSPITGHSLLEWLPEGNQVTRPQLYHKGYGSGFKFLCVFEKLCGRGSALCLPIEGDHKGTPLQPHKTTKNRFCIMCVNKTPPAILMLEEGHPIGVTLSPGMDKPGEPVYLALAMAWGGSRRTTCPTSPEWLPGGRTQVTKPQP